MKTKLSLVLLAAALVFGGCMNPASSEQAVADDSGIPANSITLDKSSLAFTDVISGWSIYALTLTATVTPIYAANRSVVWTSSDTSVATIAATSTSGVATVTPIGNGTATITASTSDASYSAMCEVTVTLETIAPGAVAGVSGIPYGNNVILSWTDPSDSDLDHVEISCSDSSVATISVDAGAQEGVVAGLSGSTTYTFSLVAVDINGNQSTEVTTAQTTTAEDSTAPSPVTGLTAVSSGEGVVILEWTDPSDTDLKAIQISVVSTDSSATIPAVDDVAAGVEMATISGLSSDASYTFTLAAVDWNYNTSSAVSSTVSTYGSGYFASGMSATTGFTGQVILTWTDPVDSDVASLTISANGTTIRSVALGTQRAVINDLTVGSEYNFAVNSVLNDSSVLGGGAATIAPVTVIYRLRNYYSTSATYYLNCPYTSTYNTSYDVIITNHSEYGSVSGYPVNFNWIAWPGFADPTDSSLVTFESTTLTGRYLRLDSADSATVPTHNNQFYAWSITYVGTKSYFAWAHQDDGTATFDGDATFRVTTANNSNSSCVSLAWYQDENRYLVADAWHVLGYLSSSTLTSYYTASFSACSSWELVEP